MFLRFLSAFVLCSVFVYHAQAASAAERSAEAPIVSAKAVDIPSVTQQIADWERIFDAHKGQDLTTVPMPELMDKVEQAIIHVTLLIDNAESEAILTKYIEEIKKAHTENALTFPLYGRFIIGLSSLTLNATELTSGPGHKIFSSLFDAGWQKSWGYERYVYSSILDSLRLGHPYPILMKKGHFAYGRIVRSYLEPSNPIHLIGMPLEKGAGSHGSVSNIKEFLGHDFGHAGDFSSSFEVIWPMVRAIFKPIVDMLPADPLERRKSTAGLYFFLHEGGGVHKEL